jgi:hypothetical protein
VDARREREVAAARARKKEVALEWKRKTERPQTFTEMKEVEGSSWSPVGQPVWLYPAGKWGLKYKVLSSSPYGSRLELASPSGLRIRTVQVSLSPLTDFHDRSWWTETAYLQTIPFYFDGATMGIVFQFPVTIGAGQAIYIDLPTDRDIENLDSCGYHSHWVGESDRRDHVHMNDYDAFSRGPRLHSDHS